MAVEKKNHFASKAAEPMEPTAAALSSPRKRPREDEPPQTPTKKEHDEAAAGEADVAAMAEPNTQVTPKKRPPKSRRKTPAAPSSAYKSMRRSSRVVINSTKQSLNDIHDLMRKEQEPGIASVEMADMKGFGVVAQKPFAKTEYVCEYSGDLITMTEARSREQQYIREDNENGVKEPMCYMYYLKYGGTSWCVDATKSGRIGRLINHSRKTPNLETKLYVVDGNPHLGLVAKRDISVGTELLYDYGERDPAAIAAHPWLAAA